MNKEYYLAHFERAEKPKAAAFLVQQFRQTGVRFLQEDEEAQEEEDSDVVVYHEAEYQRVIEKFMQTLREKKIHVKDLVLPALLGSMEESAKRKKLTKKQLPPQLPVKINKKESKKNKKHPPPQLPVKVNKSDNTKSRSRKVLPKPISAVRSGTVAELDTSSLVPWIENNKQVSEELDKYLERRGTNLTEFVASTTLCKTNFDASRDRGREISAERETTSVLGEFRRAQPMDIIAGRLGSVSNNHPGNTLFRLIVGINQGFYGSLEDRSEKHDVALALAGRFVDAGCKFLQTHDDGKGKGGARYKEVPYKRVLDKFKQGLREKCLAPKHDPSVVTPVAMASPSLPTRNPKKRKRSDEKLENEPQRVVSASRNLGMTSEKSKGSSEHTSKKVRCEKHVENLLSIGHFVLHTPKHEEEKEEDCVRTLNEIRSAFLSDTSGVEPTNKPSCSPVFHDADQAVETLARLYRTSPLRKLKGRVVDPLPVFYSDLHGDM